MCLTLSLKPKLGLSLNELGTALNTLPIGLNYLHSSLLRSIFEGIDPPPLLSTLFIDVIYTRVLKPCLGDCFPSSSNFHREMLNVLIKFPWALVSQSVKCRDLLLCPLFLVCVVTDTKYHKSCRERAGTNSSHLQDQDNYFFQVGRTTGGL